MTAAGPWSVKGIDPKAREIAKDLARRSGMTLGEWLNQMIIDGGEPESPPYEAPPEPMSRRRGLDDLYREAQAARRPASPGGLDETDTSRVARALENLSMRMESAEHRSTLAISGIDQSVMGVLSRLDDIERDQHAGAARLDGAVDEVRAAQARAGERLQRLESDDGRRTEALKALEAALARVAERVDRSADGAEAASREALDGLSKRMERIETAVEAAPAAYADAEKVETVLTRMAERLDQAETRTTAAVESMQSSFAGLDARLRTSEARGVSGAEMERRFQTLAAELAQKVEASRLDLAKRLRAAADGRLGGMETALREIGGQVDQVEKRSAQAIDRIGREVLRVAHSLGERLAGAEQKIDASAEAMGERLSAVETRSTAAVESMGGEVARIADVMEARMRQADSAQAEALEKLGGEIARIAERLADRISTSDRRSAEAIDGVADKVAKITDRIDDRYTRTASELSERIRASEERTAKLLDEARQRLDLRLQASERYAAAFEPPALPTGQPSPASATVRQDEPEADPFAHRAAEDFAEASPFDAEEDFAPAAVSRPSATPPEMQASSPPAFEPEALEPAPAFSPSPFPESAMEEAPFDQPAFADHAFGRRHHEDEPLAAPGFSVEDFAPEPTATQMSTREMLDAARQAARRAAAGGRGDIGPPPGSVPVPPLEPLPAASKPFGIGFPVRRKKEAAPTLRTIALASVTAGAITTAAVGAYLLGGSSHDGPAILDAPAPAKPVAAQAMAEIPAKPEAAAAPDLAVALTAPAAPAAEKATPPEVRKPAPAAKPPTTAPVSAEKIYAAAVNRIETGDLTGVADLKKAADLGDGGAQFYLARLYEAGGAGLPKDMAEARRWTQRAAENGQAEAMYNLASYYYGGDGGAKDVGQAVSWFKRAAEHGVVNGQYNLAQLYEKGYGVPQNLGEAYKWYTVAAAAGDADSKAAAAALKPKLPPATGQQAELAAQQLRAQLGAVKTASATPAP